MRASFINPFSTVVGKLGGFLGPIPQMLLAIAMVMVLFENERNAVQENALAFSTLGVDPRRLLSASDLVPSMQTFVDRLVAPSAFAPRCLLCLPAMARALSRRCKRAFPRISWRSCKRRRRANTLPSLLTDAAV